MYIRTEDDQHLEIHEEEDDLPYLAPVSATGWELLIDNVEFEEDEDEDKTVTIATFETVADANSALRSLRNAIELDEGWDAIEFKNGLKPASTS